MEEYIWNTFVVPVSVIKGQHKEATVAGMDQDDKKLL